MTSIIRMIFAMVISITLLSCANVDKYNKNPFSMYNKRSIYIADSNKYKIIPYNNDTEQNTYATHLSRLLVGFGLTVVDNFEDNHEGSVETTALNSDDANKTIPEGKSKRSDELKQKSTPELSLINADNNEDYIVETMSQKNSDGTVKFTRTSDNKVMGTFSISPHVYKMRPQLYAALVKMKLLKGVRYK